jgi:hypothetical protein
MYKRKSPVAVKGKGRIVYTPRSDATPEAELNALANVYRFILDCHAKKTVAESAPEPDSSNDAAIVRNTEGVSHVESDPLDHQRSHSQQHSSRKNPVPLQIPRVRLSEDS